MRWPGSSADPTKSSAAFADAAVKLLAANATEGGRGDVAALNKTLSALLGSTDDPVVGIARAAGCPDDEVATFALCVGVERSLERQRVIEVHSSYRVDVEVEVEGTRLNPFDKKVITLK